MLAEIRPTPTGAPTLFAKGQWLEDPRDPIEGAIQFANADKIKNAQRVVLFGVGLGYRVLRLRELNAANLVVFEPSKEILEICRRALPEAIEGIAIFSDVAPFLSHIVKNTTAGERMILLSPPAYVNAFPDAHKQVTAAMGEAQQFAHLGKNSQESRVRGMVENAIANLRHLEHVPWALGASKPLEGTPAFIVSAGPSLDRNVEQLRAASEKGLVFAVNTSAPAIIKADASIDVLVSIEAISVAETLRSVAAHTRTFALDLTANVTGFNVEGPEQLAFLVEHEALASIARSLGLTTLSYGASVATAAFSLAYRWGANPIVLVGQDLAYTEGRAYASGTGRDAWRAREDGDFLVIEYDEKLDTLFQQHGLAKPSRKQPRVQVPAWGGNGLVNSAFDLCLFRRWFEGVSFQLRDNLRCINATEGGAHIEGFEEKSLREVLEELGPRNHAHEKIMSEAIKVSPSRLNDVRNLIRENTKHVVQLAEKCLSARTDAKRDEFARAMKETIIKASWVSAHAAGPLATIQRDASLAKQARYKRIFETLRDSAKRIVELS